MSRDWKRNMPSSFTFDVDLSVQVGSFIFGMNTLHIQQIRNG